MNARQQLRRSVDKILVGTAAPSGTYGAILSECLRLGDAEQARKLDAHVHQHAEPSRLVRNRLLQVYGRCGKISDARRIFEEMPSREVGDYNAMLSAVSKAGSLDEAVSLFAGIPSPDSVSYNTLISLLVKRGCAAEALLCLAEMGMVPPTEYTAVAAINACAQLVDLCLGMEVHGWVVVRGLSSNLFVWNALIDMYGKCGFICGARNMFDVMPYRNVVSWNSIIAAYLWNRDYKNCVSLFSRMKASGFEPDGVTCSSVLNAYLKLGLVEDARRVFNEVKGKDEVLWTSMIAGHAQSGMDEDALGLFVEMLSVGMKLDKFVLSSVVSACAGLAFLDQGKVIHGLAVRTGFERDLLVSSAFIDMYSKCGEIADAGVIFCQMRVRNVVTWNSMIIGYSQNGLENDALAVYQRMLRDNVQPDDITFVGVLSACCHLGMVEEGKKHFYSIRDEFCMEPFLDHYACMINLLGRSGYMEEAIDMIKNMKLKPNFLIWSTLLSICRIKGDFEHGEMAARKLFELDPLDAGPYIMLSNMYAASGRWQNVAYLRKFLKDRKIKKFSAFSWIEIDSKIHKFVSDDRIHPNAEQIYDELAILMMKLQEVGFVPVTNSVLHDVDDKEKVESVSCHSEKLAFVFGLMKKPKGTSIRIIKNIRVCEDCHSFMKFASIVTARHIALRDANRFHHFSEGQCSCKDLW